MGIRRGGLTFTRYFVRGKPPRDLRKRYTRAVRAHVLAPLRPEDDATEAVGWCALERPFDLELDAAKLFDNSVLLVGFRVDRWRVPSALLRARLADEEQVLLAKTGKKRLSRDERTELKRSIALQLRRKIAPATRAFDVCWDLDGGTVLFFTHSARAKEAFTALFEKTFGLGLAEDSPFLCAERAELSQRAQRALQTVEPTALIAPRRQTAGAKGPEPADESDDQSTEPEAAGDDRDLVDRIETTRFLGSEFLLWLWLRHELGESEVSLPGLGKVESWLDAQLTLRSPINPKETVVVRGLAPSEGAEAREAVRAQKLPVSGGVVARTKEGDFSFVLKGPDLAVGRAAVPAVITEEDGDAFADRLDRIHQLTGLVDGLFARFLADRLAPVWQEAWEPAIAAWLDQRPVGPAVLQKLRGARAKGRRRAG